MGPIGRAEPLLVVGERGEESHTEVAVVAYEERARRESDPLVFLLCQRQCPGHGRLDTPRIHEVTSGELLLSRARNRN